MIEIKYFDGASCGACSVIMRKVKRILENYPKVTFNEINAVENKELASRYSVFALPLLILIVEGKEVFRAGRNIDIKDLEERIDRYYGMLFNS